MNGPSKHMPNRERFVAICRGARRGEVPILDWFTEPWFETTEAWLRQGAPEDIRTEEGFRRYFQLEHLNPLKGIVAGNYRADLAVDGGTPFYTTPPVVPVFEIKVLREDERHRVETTYGGQTVEVNKGYPWRMPRYVDYPVKDWATWNEYKKRLDPDTPARWPADWDAFAKKTNDEDTPTMLLLSGFFGMLRDWMGLERLIYAFYDEPKLVEDMMDQLFYLDMKVAQRTLKDLRIEVIRFWEDMAYRTGPLISPELFKKYMLPRYKQIADFLRKKGVETLYVESDGNINELIPIWLQCGINMHSPLEVAAGMDAVTLKKKYGNDLVLCGGIDKRVFVKGKQAIHEETMSKVPFLVESGASFPNIDGSISPEISLADFRYFINLLREIGGKDKLPE